MKLEQDLTEEEKHLNRTGPMEAHTPLQFLSSGIFIFLFFFLESEYICLKRTLLIKADVCKSAISNLYYIKVIMCENFCEKYII